MIKFFIIDKDGSANLAGVPTSSVTQAT